MEKNRVQTISTYLDNIKRTRVMEIETMDSLPTFFLKKGTTVYED